LDLVELLAVLWRSKWIILITAVVAGSVVAYDSFTRQKTYEAESMLVVGNFSSTSLPGREDELAFSYGQLVGTNEVLEKTAELAGNGSDASEFRGVATETAKDSPYLKLIARDTTALGAIDRVNAVAQGLVAYVDDLKKQNIASDQQMLLQKLTDVENDLSRLRADPNGDAGRIQALEGARQSLLRQYEELNLESSSANRLTIVSGATSATTEATRPLRNTLIALLVGAVVGTALGFATDSVRKSLRHEEGRS
jgi:capsular polysaccharide biosynthesis protein